MLRLLVYALAPVLVGAAMAFVPGVDRAWFRSVHTFTFASALTVVFAVMLPGAIAEAGPAALALFAAALAAPSLVDRAARRLRGPTRPADADGLGLELAFGGLLLHQAVDGLQIGASEVIEDGFAVVLAVAAHTTPLVAVTALAYAHHDGRRAALRRVFALAAATALGVFVGAGASTTWLVPVEPWLRAGVAGVLLTILAHDLAPEPPESAGGKLVEGAVTVVGMALPLAWLLAADGPEHHAHAHVHALPWTIGLLLAVLLLVQLGWLVGLVSRRLPTTAHPHTPHAHSSSDDA